MRSISLFRAVVPVLIASLMVGGSAGAQTLTAPPEGITVIGMGQASATPDSTRIQIILSNSGDMFGQPTMPVPEATPGASEREAVQPVVDALVNAGIAEDDIHVVVPPYLGNAFSGPYGPASALIEVTLASPTADDLTNVINAATIGTAEARMMSGGFNIMHRIEDCAPLEEQARQSAFDDAVQLATVEANVIGVSIGDVVAARDSTMVPTFNTDPSSGYADDGSCTYSPMSNIYGAFGPIPFDLSGEPVVIVYAATEVTFNIDSAATPAS